MPVRHRAREADRAHLEARVLQRRRRCLGRRCRGGSERRGGQGTGEGQGMRVGVKLFAQLRDKAGAGDVAIEIGAGATVRQVWQALVAAHPELAPFETSVSCAVNATYARMHTHVNAGDEVAFLPPVSGG
ncbi:MAG: molybdopterin converting factor subunit 1 [Acidobacteria bacterium]|nr:MAG: molybdopterin converting factor subunit 1 [Acidobacteriota bacterium]